MNLAASCGRARARIGPALSLEETEPADPPTLGEPHNPRILGLGEAPSCGTLGEVNARERDLRCDEAARSAAADDFGHIVERRPEGVLVAGSADDLAATIRWAGRRGRGFAARGQGHSTFGRSQVRDGIVADMSRLRRIGPVGDDRVVVEAGAKWSSRSS